MDELNPVEIKTPVRIEQDASLTRRKITALVAAVSYGDFISRVDFALQRESPFSYVCNACKRCCYNKAIRVGPYEILRLARYLAISTTEFISRYTEAGGTVLRTRDDDRGCIFLNERGCGVHPDRPLACRIYPLARWVSPEGEESFGLI